MHSLSVIPRICPQLVSHPQKMTTMCKSSIGKVYRLSIMPKKCPKLSFTNNI